MVRNGRSGRRGTTPVWRHTQATRTWPPPSNGRTLDPLSDLGKDYATLKGIRNLADNATHDLADARKRLSLIAIMAQTAMNRLDGNPGYLWPV